MWREGVSKGQGLRVRSVELEQFSRSHGNNMLPWKLNYEHVAIVLMTFNVVV